MSFIVSLQDTKGARARVETQAATPEEAFEYALSVYQETINLKSQSLKLNKGDAPNEE
jgi:hypothetical protein